MNKIFQQSFPFSMQRKAYFGLSSILGANIDPPSSSQESLHNTTIDTEYILHRFT